MRKNVLWIEDGAREEGLRLATPVNISGRYHLMIATNVTDGVADIRNREFDAIVIDVRLEPGTHPDWVRLYQQARLSKIKARLGIHLLHTLLKREDKETRIKLKGIPEWATRADRFGVITVESLAMVGSDLNRLGILENRYREKSPTLPVTALLELFDEITGFHQPE